MIMIHRLNTPRFRRGSLNSLLKGLLASSSVRADVFFNVHKGLFTESKTSETTVQNSFNTLVPFIDLLTCFFLWCQIIQFTIDFFFDFSEIFFPILTPIPSILELMEDNNGRPFKTHIIHTVTTRKLCNRKTTFLLKL